MSIFISDAQRARIEASISSVDLFVDRLESDLVDFNPQAFSEMLKNAINELAFIDEYITSNFIQATSTSNDGV